MNGRQWSMSQVSEVDGRAVLGWTDRMAASDRQYVADALVQSNSPGPGGGGRTATKCPKRNPGIDQRLPNERVPIETDTGGERRGRRCPRTRRPCRLDAHARGAGRRRSRQQVLGTFAPALARHNDGSRRRGSTRGGGAWSSEEPFPRRREGSERTERHLSPACTQSDIRARSSYVKDFMVRPWFTLPGPRLGGLGSFGGRRRRRVGA